jgi:hypothetical protein
MAQRKGPFTERHPELEAFLVTSNIQCLQSELQWNSTLCRRLHNPHTYLATTIKYQLLKLQDIATEGKEHIF